MNTTLNTAASPKRISPAPRGIFLEDGSFFEGQSFGAPRSVAGEVVFNTGMVGYVESLTDPSYSGQILVFTYPLIGNYGVPGAPFFESEKIQVAGLIVSEYSANYSHHSALQSLGAWLKKEKVPGLNGLDTRALTKKLRKHGVMLGKLIVNKALPEFYDPNQENLVARVSIKKPRLYKGGAKTIVALDCGLKENIVRSFVSHGVTLKRVPWDYDFTQEPFDGLFISNGPGDPTMCEATIANIRKTMAQGQPILGICLGVQLLALAAGGRTYKLKYGHRSQNQPCIEMLGYGPSTSLGASRCYITSQNHGYAVAEKSLPRDWRLWFKNANDNTVEGIRHRTKPWLAVQFHPEAAPGPTDTQWIFDEFLNYV